MAEEASCALVLLAAGGSRRLGRPKQLVEIAGEPLIRHMARMALSVRLHPTVIVLGAHAEDIAPHLHDLPLSIAINPEWTEGLASSLHVGLDTALAIEPALGGLLLMLADQPRLTAAHLNAVMSAQRERGRPVIASRYGDHLGPPAYFGREYFPALRALQGDVGARALLQETDALAVEAPPGAGADLDTPADLARLLESAPLNRSPIA